LGLAVGDRELLREELPKAKQLIHEVNRQDRKSREPENSDIYLWFKGFSIETVLYLMACSKNEDFRKWISLYITDLRKKKIILTGDDLISLGYPPGSVFQKIFKLLLQAHLNGEVQTREDEIELVAKHFSLHCESTCVDRKIDVD
jgi:tRNA nucleotidyltransferase (CCA-adding enzyme)